MKSCVVTGSSVGSLILRVVRETEESLHDLFEGQHQFSFDNRSLVAQPIDIVRWLSEHVPSTKGTLHIRNVLLNSVAGAEGRQPGSGCIALAVALEVASGHDRGLADEKARRILQLTSEAFRGSRRVSSEEAFETLGTYDPEPATLSLAQQALTQCSSNASLSVEISGALTGIRQVNGHTFPCQVPEVFLTATRFTGQRTLRDPRIVVIDGVVERMSEIEDLIGGAHVSQEPLLVFGRGFSPDVQNTLGRNYSTGHLLVFPLVVPYDELGANMLGDISVVCNADPISSFKGDLISSRMWKDLRRVEGAEVSTTQVIIRNESTSAEVHRHRRQLGDKRKSCAQVESEILDRRLQCLMGQGIVVNVGSDVGNLVGLYKDRVGSHIRLFRSMGRQGIIDTRGVVPPSFRCYHSTLGRFNRVPAASLAVGVKSGVACARSLQGLGGIIYGDSRGR